MKKYTILIADDDKEIRHALKILLKKHNYIVIEASNGKEVLNLLNASIDLVILDIMMPEKDGLETCLEIRKKYFIPILFLTAKSTEYDKCIGFSIGGDDYLQKPFSSLELLSRISAILRRCNDYGKKQAFPNASNIYIHDITIDKNTSRVLKAGVEIALTNIEYKILLLLAENPNKIFTLQNIYESVWNEIYDFSVNSTVMVHIKNLRKKLGDTPQYPKYIKNIWGRGYSIVCSQNDK